MPPIIILGGVPRLRHLRRGRRLDVDVDDLEAAPPRRILLARDFERATPTVTP
jgi:hypothetical protein